MAGHTMKAHWLVLIAGLTGCGTSGAAPSAREPSPRGEALVLARVKVIADGKAVNWSGWSVAPFRIYLQADTSSTAGGHTVSGDGAFSWHLPAGGYTLTGFAWGERSGHVVARFAAPEPPATLCIGTLTITIERGRYSPAVEDECEQLVRGFTSGSPQETSAHVTHLMRLEALR